MKGGNNQWRIIFPRQGKWFHIRNKAQIEHIHKEMLELQRSTELKAISICSGVTPDFQSWVFYTQGHIDDFRDYLKDKFGRELRIIVQAKKRHHCQTRLLN